MDLSERISGMSNSNNERVPLGNPCDFHGLEDVTHLAAAGETPFLATQTKLFERFMSDKAGGMRGRERIYEVVDKARQSVANLLGAKTSEVGFPLNVAQGVNLVTRTIA